MTASGIITLTTDFGEKDPFVGVMKGVILGRFFDARIVDLTHAITPYAPAEAGFWLARAYRWFPRGTVHAAVVDPGVGTARRALAASVDGHLFLAPDNGLLEVVLAATTEAAAIVMIDLARCAGPFGLGTASATFHGRDVFAPLAAELAAGRATLEALGDRVDPSTLVPSPVQPPAEVAGGLQGHIATIDRFGNAITNLPSAALARVPEPVVHAAGRELRVVRTYGEAKRGELVALVGAFDVLEIAEVEGDAARTLGLQVGALVSVQRRQG